MPLSFPKYCAYWFVKSGLGGAGDTDPPIDAPLNGEGRRALARRIVAAIAHAKLSASSKKVELQAHAFLAESDEWLSIFDAVDSIVACAAMEDAAETDPRAISLAFGDFLAARWIYRRVLHEELAVQPGADEAFPPPYDGDAKRGLATTLASQCARIKTPVRERGSFITAAARWKSLGDARSALLKQVMAIIAVAAAVTPLHAQLVDAGGTPDEVVAVFLQKAGDGEWQGGVATRGEQALNGGSTRVNWQLDYGSLGKTRVTPAGTTAGREPEVSKNSGIYSLGYVRPLTDRWRIKADAGFEHHRTVRAGTILNASVRTLGARTIWRGNIEPQASWLAQGNISTASALTGHGNVRRMFVDPVFVGWLSFLPGYVSMPNQPRLLFRRIQLRAEAAGISPLDRDLATRGHWDASLVFFFTPGNGLMLRRFSGYFDHNLRDRKTATTINLLWKYR